MQRFVFLLFFLCLFGAISAQYKESNIRFTLIGELHGSWLYSDDTRHQPEGWRFGGSPELHIDYFFRPQIAFSTGAAYSFLGGHMNYQESLPVAFQSGIDTLAPGTRMTYKLQYLDIPLGLKLTSREIGYVTLFFATGVNPMIRLNSLATASDNNHINDYVDKEISNFNLAYHGELGMYYSFGNNLALIIALSYKNTFLDFTTDYLEKTPENSRINSANLRIGLAF